MSIEVSVILPTCNRPFLLARCLAALQNQDIGRDRYEIIIVDDGTGDAVQRLAAAAHKHRPLPRLRHLATGGGRGPAAARNIGWRQAAGAVIAFTDDDCIPRAEWLRHGRQALAGAAGAYGRIRVPLERFPRDYAKTTAGLESAEFATANCFYRKSALALAGGFDERFTNAWREDADLFFTLLEKNERLVFAPRAVVLHPVRPAPWGVSLLEQKKTMFNALLYKKHPALYRRRIQTSPPWGYYGIVASFGGTLAAAAAGSPYAALAAAAAWLLLTALFCRRRLRETSRAFSHIAEMVVTSMAIPFLSIFWRMYGAFKFKTLVW